MKKIFWHSELYLLLFLCDRLEVDKTVLDCGAGGPRPPLTIFHEQGYQTTGIEISDHSLASAEAFQKHHNLDLNIIKGDMRKLPFEDSSFGIVYTYNTIFHMPKNEIITAIREMARVLKPGGLLYLNVMTIDDDGTKEGVDIGDYEMKQEERGETVLHCYHRDDELEPLFNELELTVYRKIKKGTDMKYMDGYYHSEYINYILQK